MSKRNVEPELPDQATIKRRAKRIRRDWDQKTKDLRAGRRNRDKTKTFRGKYSADADGDWVGPDDTH